MAKKKNGKIDVVDAENSIMRVAEFQLMPDVTSLEPEEKQKALVDRVHKFIKLDNISSNFSYWAIGEIYRRFTDEYEDYGLEEKVTVRSLGEKLGISKSTINRAVQFRNAYSEDLVKHTSKISRDAMFDATALPDGSRDKLLLQLNKQVEEGQIKSYQVKELIGGYLDVKSLDSGDDGPKKDTEGDPKELPSKSPEKTKKPATVDDVIAKGRALSDLWSQFSDKVAEAEELTLLSTDQINDVKGVLENLKNVTAGLEALIAEDALEED